MDLNARFIQPMRDELTGIGFQELLTPEAVDAALGNREGTTLVFVNSVCGCAAGMARPGGWCAFDCRSGSAVWTARRRSRPRIGHVSVSIRLRIGV